MTFAVDWALKTSYLSTVAYVKTCGGGGLPTSSVGDTKSLVPKRRVHSDLGIVFIQEQMRHLLSQT